jgi:hypothetical protein
MDVGDFLVNLCISLEAKILGLISQQAEWEIPLHALLYQELAARGLKPAREENYPGAGGKSLDLIITYDGKQYAIEVKVESASRPGQIAEAAFMTADRDFGPALTEKVGGDIAKVQRFYNYGASGDTELRNLVLLLAYTAKAQALMAELAADTPPSKFGQGLQTFDHSGKNGRGARNGQGSKLTVGLYYADYY